MRKNRKPHFRSITFALPIIFTSFFLILTIIFLHTESGVIRSQAYDPNPTPTPSPPTCINGSNACVNHSVGDPCSENGYSGTCQTSSGPSDCTCLPDLGLQCPTFYDETSCTTQSYCEWTGSYCRTNAGYCSAAGSLGICNLVLDCRDIGGECVQRDEQLYSGRTDCENLNYNQCTSGFYNFCYYDQYWQDCLRTCESFLNDSFACIQHFDRCHIDANDGSCKSGPTFP